MNIAFVAMSGVRVRSPELAALGVSLPGFVERGRVIASLPSLGLLTIAGATPRRHRAAYFEHADTDAIRLRASGFDVVAISTFTAQAHEAYDFADACRAAGLRVAFGGLHATVRPEEAAAHADHVFAGEGEETWPEFLDDLERGAARPFYDARGRVFDLARAPLPRYDLLDPARYNRLTVQTARSCPHACTFCASGLLLRGPYRRKPLSLVARDLDAIGRLWPGAFVELADDNTFADPRQGVALAELFRVRGMKWFTETDITVADHPGLLDALARSGCRQLLIGLEALDQAEVAGMERRPFKAPRVPDYAAAVRRIQERGVSVNGCFIVGADDHTPAVFERVRAFAESSGLAEVQVTVLTPFPGTPLHDRLAREGRLLEPGRWDGCTLFDVIHRPLRMTVAELEEGLRFLFSRLYSPQAVRRRRRLFRDLKRRQVRAASRGWKVAPRGRAPAVSAP